MQYPSRDNVSSIIFSQLKRIIIIMILSLYRAIIISYFEIPVKLQ